ncbi:MAG: hypothetical protein COA32_03805 [Fluviicola sp.]|nr:MAG: hypothetical protein COA32_03805 [Fluviicola sp.]
MRLFYILILLISFNFTFAQPTLTKKTSDSLWTVWQDKNQPDTARLDAIYNYTRKGYLFSKPDSAFHFANQAYQFAKKRNLKTQIADALTLQGISFAIQGNYSQAIEIYFKSLNIFEELNDKNGAARTLGNIGVLYQNKGEDDKAIENFTKSLDYFKAIKDPVGIAKSLNNIAVIYIGKGKYQDAIDYCLNSLRTKGETNVAEPLNNLGIIYDKKGEFTVSLDYHFQSLEANKKYGNQLGVAKSFTNIGNVYRKQKSYSKALTYSKKGLDLAQNLGINLEIQNAAESLWKTHKDLGNYQAALKMHELFVQTRDSIKSEENQRAVIQQEYKYKYEKQVALDSLDYAKEQKLAQAESDKKDAEIKAKRSQQYALLGGLGLTLLFAGFMYNRFRKAQQQKVIIEKQKDEVNIQKLEAEKQRDLAKKEHRIAKQQRQLVEEKNTEILTSIDTAKRLRASILPPVKLVKQHFDTSFVIYKSKKIVNGNFYWMEAKENVILFAVAAYTGNSASGAMISVSCVSSLNKTVKELNKTDPADILNTTFNLMKNTFSNSVNEIKENMNITLCVLNERTETLVWAGAKNPLWIVRHKNNVLEEVELTKKREKQKDSFVSQTVNIKGGDSIYMFSDGETDHLNKEKVKKNDSNEIKNLLLAIRHKNMAQQKKELNQALEKYKEDVCMIGVQLPKKENNPFTRREREILQLLEQGKSSKIIADELNISKSTVDTHRRKMLRKVEVNSVTELLNTCRKKNWL